MYTSFFDLKHKPFQIDTDPRFLWLGEKHQEAFLTLKYGLADVKGMLLLTGDVGTGKTTLINALLTTLDADVNAAFIRDPSMEPLEFLKYTAHSFGMDSRAIDSKTEFLIQFEEYLNQCYEDNRKALLIIDEAQRISQDLLEEIRLLSNIEKNERKQLSIFFIGQIEFNETLLRFENRAIRQRISINYNIEPLTEDETRRYIRHRLQVSSTNDNVGFFSPISKSENGQHMSSAARLPLPEVQRDIFSPGAIKAVHTFSKGFPRLINTICDRALLTGFIENCHTISKSHVEECVKELKIQVSAGSSQAFPQYQTYTSPKPAAAEKMPNQACKETTPIAQHTERIIRVSTQDSSEKYPAEESGQTVREILDEIDEKLESMSSTQVDVNEAVTPPQNDGTDNRNLSNVIIWMAIITLFASVTIYIIYPDAIASLMENTASPENNSNISATKNISSLPADNQQIQPSVSKTGNENILPKKMPDSPHSPAGIVFDFPQEATTPSAQTLDEINALAFLLTKKPFRQIHISYFEDSTESSPSGVGTAKFHAYFLNSYFMGKGIDSAKIDVLPAASTAQKTEKMANSAHTPIVVDIIW